MPTRFRYERGCEPQVIAWAGQGVRLLGLPQVRQSARYLRGYELLTGGRLFKLATPSVERAHAARFPEPFRLQRVGSLAALLNLPVRNGEVDPAEVEGDCVCCGTGWVHIQPGVRMRCPVHEPNEYRPTTGSAPMDCAHAAEVAA
jgi:hypothetical protein